MDGFITKYIPATLDEHTFNLDVVRVVKMRIALDDLNLILVGGEGSGKTTLINNIIREYYNVPPGTNADAIVRNNVLRICSLKDQGTLFCRNDLKIFCQVKSNIARRKKIVRIDNLDQINDHNQHIFRSLIDNYGTNVHFLCSALHVPKIIDHLQSRILMLGISIPKHHEMLHILDKVIKNEGITATRTARNYIVHTSRGSISRMLNQTEKLLLAGIPMTKANIHVLCDGISNVTLEQYTNYCKANNYASAIQIILELHGRGYSIIDIFDEYYQYIKYIDESIVTRDCKYRLVIVICEYITNFHEFFEHEIELLLFTQMVINVFILKM